DKAVRRQIAGGQWPHRSTWQSGRDHRAELAIAWLLRFGGIGVFEFRDVAQTWPECFSGLRLARCTARPRSSAQKHRSLAKLNCPDSKSDPAAFSAKEGSFGAARLLLPARSLGAKARFLARNM